MKFALKPLHSVFRDKEHGWGPFVWLVYLGFFFIQPVMDHFNAKQWTVDLLGAAVFVVLYLGIFLLEKPIPLVHIGGMVLLGMAYIPYNGGASAFFIFAGAFVPFLVDTQK